MNPCSCWVQSADEVCLIVTVASLETTSRV